tara:strand:+ start:8191 stop:8565 length:375 start_codon:yes stop_codon:yes gene_type:complete
MKSKYLLVKHFLYIFSIIISSFSCTKNSQITFYWDETGCSDPWLDFYTADTFSQEAQNNAIRNYLLSENIDLISLSHEYDSSKAEFCLACHCKTGKVFELIVSKNDKRKMKNLGLNQFDLHFYQ